MKQLVMTVLPQEVIDNLQSDVKELKEMVSSMVKQKTADDIQSEWIESVKMPGILGVSRRTWQTYRDERLIPFSQIGMKIYVNRKDLDEYFLAHRIDKV